MEETMEFGCCVNLLPHDPAWGGLEYAAELKKLGYDYVEYPLKELAAMDGQRFAEFLHIARWTGLPCHSCNDMLPPCFQLVGPQTTSVDELSAYLEIALVRASQLGASCVVFGSPWSRRCPDGFPLQEAEKQIIGFLCCVADIAARFGLIVAVEHNNHTETNTLNHYADVVRIAKLTARPNVGPLCDYYHLRMENDSPQVVLTAAPVHTHFSQKEERAYMTDLTKEPQLPEYAAILSKLGYHGGVSVESRVKSKDCWSAEAGAVLALLRSVFSQKA
jgi:D-psicose/D-tagatose/L-ribulose 3-epimerase